LKDHKTPAAPNSTLEKLREGEEVIDESMYQKLVGKLLYAVLRVLPDCANAIRDLTCHLSSPGEQHWKALAYLLGYLKHNYKRMKLRSPLMLRVINGFDSDWGSNKDDRKSISSLLTTIGGTALVNFQSKKQQSVALSSCEAETMAGTLVAQDVLYVYNLLAEILGTENVEKPCYVYGDNAASLFLAQNNSVGQRTKHIDIQHRFLHDLVMKELVELRHVRTENNTSDVNSKNTLTETHLKHAERLYDGTALVDIQALAAEASKEDIELVGSIRLAHMTDSYIGHTSLMPRRQEESVNASPAYLLTEGACL
jgi:hypothetical protein